MNVLLTMAALNAGPIIGQPEGTGGLRNAKSSSREPFVQKRADAVLQVSLWRKLTHGDAVQAIAFSPGGMRLATGGWEGTVKWWDVQTGRRLRVFRKRGDRIDQVAFSQDGSTFMAVSHKEDEQGYRIWADFYDARIGKFRNKISGRNGVGYVFALSPDGRTLAGAGIGFPDGTWYAELVLWDARTAKRKRLLTSPNWGFSSLAYSPDGRTLAGGLTDGAIRLCRADTGAAYKTLGNPKFAILDLPNADSSVPPWTVCTVSYSRDGQVVAAGDYDGKVCIWQAKTGKLLRKLQAGRELERRSKSYLRTIALSPDGRLLAVGTGLSIQFWEARTGTLLRTVTIQTHPLFMEWIAFSPDGALLASSGGESTAFLWRIQWPSQRPAR